MRGFEGQTPRHDHCALGANDWSAGYVDPMNGASFYVNRFDIISYSGRLACAGTVYVVVRPPVDSVPQLLREQLIVPRYRERGRESCGDPPQER